MTLAELDRFAITPALDLLPENMRGPRATAMLCAIALQESGATARVQRTVTGRPGPARGFWQFERLGGCAEVLTQIHIAPYTHALCARLAIRQTPTDVWEAVTYHDVFAAACARLLLWIDPAALPDVDHATLGWQLYLRRWRPGKPHPNTWGGWYAQAWVYVQGR